MKEQFPQFESNPPIEKKEDAHLVETFPMGDAFLDHYRERHPEDTQSLEIMKDVVYTFLDEQLRNTEIFRSQETAVEMPLTVLHMQEFAKEIFTKYGDRLPSVHSPENEDEKNEEERRKRIKFIMSSFKTPQGGNQFGYVELVLHEAIKSLPRALRALKEGRAIPEYDIYNLGSPTNVMGQMNEVFSEKLKTNTFEAMGELYAECVQNKPDGLNLEEKGRTTVILEGVSMGSAMAAEAAKALLEKNKASQETSPKDMPRLRLNLYVPAALGESLMRSVRIPAAYVAEALYQITTEPGTQKVIFKQKKFLEAMYQNLPVGITQRMGSEQKKLKTKGVRSIIKAISRGVPLPPGIKANEVIGIYDPLMFSFERKIQASKQEMEHGGTLGQNILKPGKDGERIFGVKMTHRIPFFRDNEFRRWDIVAKMLKNQL